MLWPRQSLLLRGSEYHPAVEQVGDRLKQARLAAGYATAAEAAAAHGGQEGGWHPQNVRDHEANRRGVDADQAERYGRAYRVDPAWLLFGGANRKPKGNTLVPVVGFVGADPSGQVLFSEGQGTGDQAPLPPGGTPRAVALEVRGRSMPDVAEDGALLYFEDQHTHPTREHIGRVVVCELQSGEVLVKRLLRGDQPDLWDLESIVGPTRHGVRIKWVANISAIVPPPHSQRIIVRAGTVAA